jgi:hypothetical protein
MAISRQAIDALSSMGEQLGLAWQANTRKTRGTEEVLHICIGDGYAPTKIDGWIHACTLTTKAIIKYVADKDAGLDIVGVTSWSGGNSALRYARWQADFHWKIDTRPWQFFLYMFPMKWAFRDAILQCDTIGVEDSQALLSVNEGFWEEVVVAYINRSEVIERSRRYAPHPDPTCGSSWQGYPYRHLWDRDDPSFEELAMPFIEKGKSEYGRVEGKVEPKPFPPMENQMDPGLPTLCWDWIKRARAQGISDDWLRVRLGTRWVPTRFNGWWASIDEILRFLEPYARDRRAAVQANGQGHDYDVGNYAVRFALCHAEFQRRPKGQPEQLIGLLETAREPLRQVLADRDLPRDKADAFLDEAIPVIRAVFAADRPGADPENLPELNVARPLHPRYAPPDPLEPLHWEVPNTERYLKKMAQLGYTL